MRFGSELDGASVLVTGGAGFIGGHIADTLADHASVTVLDDFSTGAKTTVPPSCDVVEADIRDADAVAAAVEGCDVVFHEAAVVDVSQSVETPIPCHDVNVDGTLNVLEAARTHDARVVVASSAAIYGPPTSTPIEESEPTDPMSPYGIDKLAIDHYTRCYHDLYGVDTVALRYFNAYGPGQSAGAYSGVIDAFFEQARAGEALTVYGDGEQTRDFVHVEDIVQANLLAATTDDVGEAYNVGTGTSVTIRELAEEVKAAVGSESPIVHTDPREGDIRHSRADVARANRKLGYEPTVSLGDGLATLVGDW
ncbi:UDP-glucose 4-epimerase [Halopelagius inordinatus]|uniref:UDP-glucose 4-epimerase n=1 Tax=Halopelagius inordinatus TaxID=553467 RepID=A0A1I2UCN5_9EURY|nr:NAD-dependent epimerase/dehydratase family protein [Halopelagius inordinatus]SFG72451.1 UDP-glucose 4-epimerase [Halopelagius inordinatus]